MLILLFVFKFCGAEEWVSYRPHIDPMCRGNCISTTVLGWLWNLISSFQDLGVHFSSELTACCQQREAEPAEAAAGPLGALEETITLVAGSWEAQQVESREMERERAACCTILSQLRMQHPHPIPIRTTAPSAPSYPFLFTVVTAAVDKGPFRKQDVRTLERRRH